MRFILCVLVLMSTFSSASKFVENNIYFVDGGNAKPTMYPPVGTEGIFCNLLALKSHESMGLEPFSVKDGLGNSLDTLQEEQDLSIVNHDHFPKKENVDIRIVNENGPNLHISFKFIYKEMPPVQIDKKTVIFAKHALKLCAEDRESEMTIGPLYLKSINTDCDFDVSEMEQSDQLIVPTLINTIKRIPVKFLNKKSV